MVTDVFERKVELYCPVCGGNQFSSEYENKSPGDIPGDTELTCGRCGKISTKDELIESNGDVIEANIEEIKQQAIKEIEKQLKKAFK